MRRVVTGEPAQRAGRTRRHRRPAASGSLPRERANRGLRGRRSGRGGRGLRRRLGQAQDQEEAAQKQAEDPIEYPIAWPSLTEPLKENPIMTDNYRDSARREIREV